MKQHGTCVGCKKRLKKGEFVVLNGGAMIKTRANARVRDGAVMGDWRHVGFLTVMNHFDSKKNYRSMLIEDNGPNGQFEFYACSHKCLIDFLTRHIKHLAKLDKIKKFVLASQSRLEGIGYDWGLKVVNFLGVKRALITDESTISDFTGSPVCTDPVMDSRLQKAIKKLGFKINYWDPIWKVAGHYKMLRRNKKMRALLAKGLTKEKAQKKFKDHKIPC